MCDRQREICNCSVGDCRSTHGTKLSIMNNSSLGTKKNKQLPINSVNKSSKHEKHHNEMNASDIIHVIVRPLSTVGYTSVVASVIHSRQWSN